MLLRLYRLAPDLATVDAFAEPWQKLYAHSTAVATLVLFGHIAGVLVAGALAYAAEAAALRLDPADEGSRHRYLAAARGSYGAIAIALGLTLLCGVLLFLSDVEAFGVSPVFWTKMGLVVVLLGNGVAGARLDARLRRTGAATTPALTDLWRRRRSTARTSAVLWFALVLSGTALASH